MKAIRLSIAFAIAWCMQAGTSYAVEDWLDKLSGPGPFLSHIRITYRFVCFSRSADQMDFGRVPNAPEAPDETFVTWLHPFALSAGIVSTASVPQHPTFVVTSQGPQASLAAHRREAARRDCNADRRVAAYSTITYGHWSSLENQLFPQDRTNKAFQVKLDEFTWAYAIRVHRALDVGVGAGITTFSGDAFDSFERMSLMPLTLEFSPFAALGDGVKFRAIRVTGGAMTFVRSFDQSDFCQPPRCAVVPTPFSTKPELLWRVGLHIDIPGVIQAFRRQARTP